MSQTVLVTGAAGFIGSHLCERLLRDGYRVAGLDNFCDFYDPAQKRLNLQTVSRHPTFNLWEGDLRDRAFVMNTVSEVRPWAVIHLAAMAGVRPSIADPSLYTSVNLDGTVNLLDAATGLGQGANPAVPPVSRFVFASSSSVYGNNDKVPFAEADNVDHPISPYAATKKAGELLCHTYWHLTGVPITCLRFFTVYGPRQRPDLAIAKFLRAVASGTPISRFGDGSTSRDYTYIDDIITGVTSALERPRGYQVYNLGNNQPTTLDSLIRTIERVVGRSAVIEDAPLPPGDVQRTWACLDKSRADLDYQPTTLLEDGITAQWQWYRESTSDSQRS